MRLDLFFEYHPRAWVDRSSPAYKESRPPLVFVYLSLPSRGEGREGEAKRESRVRPCRLDLNNPPTSVGGIQRRLRAPFCCRLDLNNPPTPVGGIQEKQQSPFLCRLDLN